MAVWKGWGLWCAMGRKAVLGAVGPGVLTSVLERGHASG